MAKVGVDKVDFDPYRSGGTTQYCNFSAQPASRDGWVQPTAPPMSYEDAVTQQPTAQEQPSFRPMPEPGPINQPPYQPQASFQSHQPSPHIYQPPSSASRDAQLPYLPMPEPEPVYQPRPQFQPQLSPMYQPSTSTDGGEAPPSYYESQLAQDSANRFRTDIFNAMNRLKNLKTLILEREGRLSETQRRSELLDGVYFGDNQVLTQYHQEMNNLQSCFRAAQQHLKDKGEKETHIPGTGRKKTKLHIDGCGCCGVDSHYYRDLCHNKPKIHIEGMCKSPDVYAETCENQNKHNGWIWGKQKIHVDGMWFSPKVHLKGLLINPVIHVEGMFVYPEIHIEGTCLNPEIHVDGIGIHPTIRITGLCHRLKIHVEGIRASAKINLTGVCDQVETRVEGCCAGATLSVTGACKDIRRSLGIGSPSVKFKGSDMIVQI